MKTTINRVPLPSRTIDRKDGKGVKPGRTVKVAVPHHWYFLCPWVPVTTIVSYQFQGLNSAVTVDEVSHTHLLCPSKDVFCGRSHYFLHVLLLSIKQNQTWAKLILPPKCEASYIHNTFHSVVSVTFRQRRTVNKIYERSHRFSRELASWWKECFSSPGHGKVKFTSQVNCWIKHLQKCSFSEGFRKQIMQLDLG